MQAPLRQPTSVTGMRILIVKLSSFGDILHALPAVNSLRCQLPARIDWVTQAEYASLVACFPDVGKVFPVRRHQGWRGFLATCRALRREAYDLVIDLQGLQKSALVARLAGGRRCIGPSYHREGARIWYHETAPPADGERHAVIQAMDVLPMLGISRPEQPLFPIVLPAKPALTASPRVGIAPVSRWPSKNWPVDRYTRLARLLQERRGASITILGGEDSLAAARAIREGCSGTVNIQCGNLDWPELGAAIKDLDVLVANDSGPVHLAAALEVPCVVFYGPTVPRRTGPWGGRHRIMVSRASCAGCYRRNCPYPDNRCWEGMEPEEICRAVVALLEEQPLEPSGQTGANSASPANFSQGP